jgi:hypothetical protein
VVRVQHGSRFEDRAVTVAALNAHEAMIGSGLDEGASSRAMSPRRDRSNVRHAQVLHTSAQRPGGARRDYHRRGRRLAATRRGGGPDLPTARVTRGEFVDTLEIRGEIKPLKSVVLSSPMQSGELQILKLAKSGTMVKAGDVLVQFDPSTLQRTSRRSSPR